MITSWKLFNESVKWGVEFPVDLNKHYSILYNTVEADTIRVLNTQYIMSSVVKSLLYNKGKNKYRSDRISIIDDVEVSKEVGFVDHKNICYIFDIVTEEFTKTIKLPKSFVEKHNLPADLS